MWNEIHGTRFPSLVSRRTLRHLPKCQLTAPPTIPLEPAMKYSATPSRTLCAIRGVAGNKTLSLGAAGYSWELGAASCSCWEQGAKECLCFPGFPGTHCPAAEVTGLPMPHSGLHYWYILSHYERNLERDDSRVGQCSTSSCLSCQFPSLLF